MDHASNVEKAIVAQLGKPDSPLLRRVTQCNQIWLHNYSVEAVKTCRCGLPGCGMPFEITLIPNQVVYPKFCEAHRTEYRREFHLQKLEAAVAVPSEDDVQLSAIDSAS